MCNEIWKPIVGYEDYYEVSNFGRVRRVKSAPGTLPGKILRPLLSTDGYLDIYLSINGDVKEFRIHRLVAMAFIPNPENKPFVNHRDGNKQNNALSNLEWVTHQENCIHAWKTGLCKPCTGYHHTEEARRKMSESHKGRQLSEEHRKHISESNIGRQVSEETRKKISESLKGKIRSDLRGHEVSQETRMKISEAQRKRWQKQKEKTL